MGQAISRFCCIPRGAGHCILRPSSLWTAFFLGFFRCSRSC